MLKFDGKELCYVFLSECLYIIFLSYDVHNNIIKLKTCSNKLGSEYVSRYIFQYYWVLIHDFFQGV